MKERIKELAEQAGFDDFPDDENGVWITDGYWNEQLERFAELVRQDEREACAKLCDDLAGQVGNKNFIAVDQRQFCAKQIRARSKEQGASMTDHTAIQETDEMKQQWAKHIEQGASMTRIDLIIDALSFSQNSVWSKLNEQALAAARELQAEQQEPVNTMPTKIVGPNLEQILNAAGFYKREWVGLTDDEIKGILDCGRGGLVDIKKAEQILKEKNGGS